MRKLLCLTSQSSFAKPALGLWHWQVITFKLNIRCTIIDGFTYYKNGLAELPLNGLDGVSKRLCNRLTLAQLHWPVWPYRCISLFYWWIYNYAGHTADILTLTAIVQGVGNHSWGLYRHHCYCICLCLGCFSRIFHFSHWLGQQIIVLIKDAGYTFTPWVVYFTPCS